MVKDIFDSLKDNFAQKARNPILATIIIIWTFKNWRLIYGLFTFDPKVTQETKLAYIENYFNTYPFYPILGECIWYGIIVLVITYVISGVGRLIVNLYDYKLNPFLSYVTDSWGPVTRDRFEQKVKELDEQRDKYELERLARIKATGELATLEKSVGELTLEASKVPGLNSDNEELKSENSKLNFSVQQLDRTTQELNKIKENNKLLLHDKENFQAENIRLVKIHEKEITRLNDEIQKYKFTIKKFENVESQLEETQAQLQEMVNKSLGNGRVMRGTPPKSS